MRYRPKIDGKDDGRLDEAIFRVSVGLQDHGQVVTLHGMAGAPSL